MQFPSSVGVEPTGGWVFDARMPWFAVGYKPTLQEHGPLDIQCTFAVGYKPTLQEHGPMDIQCTFAVGYKPTLQEHGPMDIQCTYVVVHRGLKAHATHPRNGASLIT